MNTQARQILEKVKSGELSVDDALVRLKAEPFEELGYAKPDLHRAVRQGVPEVIYGEGKTPKQIAGILKAMHENGQTNVIITRLTKASADIVKQSTDITYDEVYESMDNLWNFMFFTGYFKKISERFEDRVCYVTMKIPDQEVLYIFENKIRSWFETKLKNRNSKILFDAIKNKKTDIIKEEIRKMLYDTISYYDYHENFYHGVLAGLLYGMEYYSVKSNRENGKGRTDIVLKPLYRELTVYIFEFKIAKNESKLQDAAVEAIRQINDKKYDTELINDGYENIVKYGIAFCGKDCYVVME